MCFIKPRLTHGEYTLNALNLSKPTILLIALTSLCFSAFADQQTDWLEPHVDYEGNIIDAKVRSIESWESGDSKRVTLSIPKDAIATTAEIEEIVVVGKAPKQDDKPVKVKIHYEWASDYDNDNYGLIITIDKATNFPIRLYLKGDTETP